MKGSGPMRGGWHPGYHPDAFVGLACLLLLTALLIVGIVLLVRYLNRNATPPRSGGSGPLQILEERFARGEIDEDEFKRRREILRS